MFLLNSRLGRFSAADFSSREQVPLTYRQHPLSRSYGVILPSSFSTDHSSTLGFSPRLPVSDCGTVRQITSTRSFSWRPAPKLLAGINSSARHPVLCLISRICLRDHTTPLHRDVHSPDSLLASASLLVVRRNLPGTRIFARFPSSTALALDLGAG